MPCSEASGVRENGGVLTGVVHYLSTLMNSPCNWMVGQAFLLVAFVPVAFMPVVDLLKNLRASKSEDKQKCLSYHIME